jgi:F0F1-type ATP synthase epsilon subunit
MFGTCQAGLVLNANEKQRTQSGVSILASTMTFQCNLQGSNRRTQQAQAARHVQNARFGVT